MDERDPESTVKARIAAAGNRRRCVGGADGHLLAVGLDVQLQRRLAAIGIPTRATRTAALSQLAVQLPAAVLARCIGIDISSAVAWQRVASGDWRQYAGRLGPPEDDPVTVRA